MTELIPLEEARAIVLSHVEPLDTVEVDLLEVAGRVAAEDLKCDIDNSPFPHSAMDGFAVKAEWLENASEENPVELEVITELAAGDYYEGTLNEGECLRIMTGAAVPDCVDSVVKYEIVGVVRGDGKPGSRVSFTAPTKFASNVCEAGEEAKAGETVVHAGEVINSAGLGFLASCGVTRVPTYKRPTVAIMATGSELVDPTEVPGPGKIRNSNGHAIASCVIEAGGIPVMLPIVKDSYDVLKQAVKDAAGKYDFVITTGGAAAGDFDFIEPVVRDLGEVYLTRVNMRPGKAETFGKVDGVPVFGLPGNPAAAYIGFQMLARPALRKMQGYTNFDRVRLKARLATDIRGKKDSRMTLSRATITKDAEGNYEVAPMQKQSSALFGPLQRSNALIVIPNGSESHAAGELIECIILDVPEEVVL